MAKFSHVVEYALKTTYDAAGITKLERDLSRVQTELTKLMQLPNTKVEMKGLDQSIRDVEKLKTALMSAFNTDIGMLDMRRFQSEISKAKISVEGLQKAFKTSGVAGQQSFAALTAKIASFDSGMKSISTTTQKVFNTFANTVRWGVTASVFETMNNDLRRAVEYVQELDSSLNAIRIVSGESAEYMRDFAKQATEAASALGKTTTDFTNASLIYIQQGKNIQEANKLAELTLKTANVTGQETSEVSEQLTSLMNGYQIAVDDMEASVDKLAKVAAVGASDLEELATAESKVASTANALGVSQDQLVAQLSTIISVTRQAPESVGNAIN